jgi:integrase
VKKTDKIVADIDALPYYKRMGVGVHSWKNDRFGRERFRIYWRYKGKQYAISIDEHGGPLLDRRLAEALAAKIALEIADKKHDPERWRPQKESKYTIANAVKNYLGARLKDNQKQRLTTKHYKDLDLHLKKLVEFSETEGVTDIREFKGYELQKMFDDHLPTEWSYSTKRKYRATMSGFFNWALKKAELIDSVPALPDIGEEEKRLIKYLAAEQQEKLYKKLDKKFRPIVRFLMVYGCRPSEALAIQLEDVNWENRTVYVKRAISDGVLKEKNKTNKIRAMYISDSYAPELRELTKNRIGSDYLFVNPETGSPFTLFALDKAWRMAADTAGFDHTLVEGTRKSLTDSALRRGIDVETIAEALGNSPKVLLEHYGQISAGRTRNVFDKDIEKKVVPLKKPNKKTS